MFFSTPKNQKPYIFIRNPFFTPLPLRDIPLPNTAHFLLSAFYDVVMDHGPCVRFLAHPYYNNYGVLYII